MRHNQEQIQKYFDELLNRHSFSKREKVLLQYLIAKQLKGEDVTEYHLASEVFSKDEAFDPSIDSTVRVNIRKLRLKLKEFYLTNSDYKVDIHFVIPKGRYGIEFSTEHEEPKKKIVFHRTVIIALLIIIMLFAFITIEKSTRLSIPINGYSSRNRIEHPVWNEFSKNGKTTLIVIGDLYFARMFEGKELQFIVRNDELNKAEDIHNFNDEYQLRNYSLTYTPSDITENALKIYTKVFDGENDVRIEKASKLDVEVISENNIIYLGDCLAMWDLRKVIKQFNVRYLYSERSFLFKDTNDTIRFPELGNQHRNSSAIVMKRLLPNDNIFMLILSSDRFAVSRAIDNLRTPESLKIIDSKIQKKCKEGLFFNLVYEVSGMDEMSTNSEITYFMQY